LKQCVDCPLFLYISSKVYKKSLSKKIHKKVLTYSKTSDILNTDLENRRQKMTFKKPEWESRKGTEVVANMAFSIQLTVYEYDGEWIWKMGNLSFGFKQGRAKDKERAKKKAEHAFHLYVLENLDMCTE
jgi:hypothetical protein